MKIFIALLTEQNKVLYNSEQKLVLDDLGDKPITNRRALEIFNIRDHIDKFKKL